jgi:hypothetical protein
MRTAGRMVVDLGGLVVVLWPAGVCIHEPIALSESDLDRRCGSRLVHHGKGRLARSEGTSAPGLRHAHAVEVPHEGVPPARRRAAPHTHGKLPLTPGGACGPDERFSNDPAHHRGRTIRERRR